MITACRIVLAIVTCVSSSAEQHVKTPAEAVAVLRASHSDADVSHRISFPRGPNVASTSAKGPTLGPWEFPKSAPARRLDGTLLTDPPVVYGAPAGWPYNWWAWTLPTAQQRVPARRTNPSGKRAR